jgi:hypothetical protein
MKINIYSLHAYKISYLCDFIRKMTRLSSVKCDDFDENFSVKNCDCGDDGCVYDDYIETSGKIHYNIESVVYSEDDVEFLLDEDKFFDSNIIDDEDIDYNARFDDLLHNEKIRPDKIIYKSKDGYIFYKNFKNGLFERLYPKSIIRKWLANFKNYEDSKDIIVSQRPIIIARTGNIQGLDHCKFKLDCHEEWKLEAPVKYKDLVDAIYRVRSFKLKNKNELYRGSFVAEEEHDVLKIELIYK